MAILDRRLLDAGDAAEMSRFVLKFGGDPERAQAT
jgi:hypothetical protein